MSDFNNSGDDFGGNDFEQDEGLYEQDVKLG